MLRSFVVNAPSLSLVVAIFAVSWFCSAICILKFFLTELERNRRKDYRTETRKKETERMKVLFFCKLSWEPLARLPVLFFFFFFKGKTNAFVRPRVYISPRTRPKQGKFCLSTGNDSIESKVALVVSLNSKVCGLQHHSQLRGVKETILRGLWKSQADY